MSNETFNIPTDDELVVNQKPEEVKKVDTGPSWSPPIQPEEEIINTELPLSSKTQRVFDIYNSFQKDIGPYVTFDDAKSIVDSGYDNDTYLNVIKNVEARKAKDIDSFVNEGRNLDLVTEALGTIREKTAKGGRPEIAEKLNIENFKDNYNVVKEFIDEDEVYKVAGIDPQLPGVSNKTRAILSFALYDDKTIETQAKDAIIAALPEKDRDKYLNLNYEGPKIHVQNYKFDDGEKRLIYKIPKELGGDNQYQLFNKPGITLEDFSGFAGELIPLASEITAGVASAELGPAGVAFNTAVAGGLSEMLRLYIGQQLGVNQELTAGDIALAGAKRAAITGVSTRLMFPIMDKANKLVKNLANKFAPSSTGTLSNKVVKDIIYSYKNGLNKDQDTDFFIKQMKDQLTKSTDEGGAGLDPKEVDKLIRKTFGNNNPGTALSELEKAAKSTPQGATTKRVGDLIGKEGYDAAVQLEKESVNAIDEAVQKILGVSYKKVPANVTEREIFDGPINLAIIKARNNKIRLSNVSEKLNEEWSVLSNKVYNRIKTNPEEVNFNKILVNFVDDLNTSNYQIANTIRGKIDKFYKNEVITIPKGSSTFQSPNKIFTDAANTLKGRLKILKKSKDDFSKKQIAEYEEAINTLNFLKGQFQTGKKFKYIDAVNAKGLLEDIAATNPKLSDPMMKALATLNSAIGTAKPLPAQLAAQHSDFIMSKSILRGDVVGKIISKLGGTPRGPVANAKAMSQDFFPVLFGNKPEQQAATKYLGSFMKDNKNVLDQKMISDFKTTIYDRFIKETTGDNAISASEFVKKYGSSLKNIFTESEMRDFTRGVAVKRAIEKIQTKYLDLNVKAQRTMPLLQEMDATQITPFMISEQIFGNAKLTPRAVNQFFSSISKEQGNEIRGYFMKTLFDQTKSTSGILGKDTLDGGKLFQWFSNGRNQQVFENLFGKAQVKNMKTLAAALEFMQRPEKYIKPGQMTAADADRVRQTVTRMVYGPLSHENILIKGALYFLNKMDTKLGKELFDYDFFLEKFKNSYAFKYAPQLNDKAFLNFFNRYDAGATQRIYTGTVAAVGGSGTEQTLRGALEDETGLPTLPVLETIAKAPFVGGAEATKAFRSGLNEILDSVDSDTTTKKRVLEQFREKDKGDTKK
jgi:hypothetical protein